MSLRKAPKAPLAVAAILAMPLFFTALMAVSLAVEKPTVAHVVRRGVTVAKLGEPSGTTEATIWTLAIVAPLAVVAVGAGATLIGRPGVIVSALAAIAATIVFLVPLGTWTARHTARYPDGVDLIRQSSTSDIYLRGEWEGTARRTGVVTAVGSDSAGIEPGDKVVYPREAGFEVRLGGAAVKVMRRGDLIARVHD